MHLKLLIMLSGHLYWHCFTQDLITNSPDFTQLIEQYGRSESSVEDTPRILQDKGNDALVAKTQAPLSESPQMQLEDRQTGAVSWSIYGQYLRYGGGLFWAPVFAIVILTAQAAEGKIPLPSEAYH